LRGEESDGQREGEDRGNDTGQEKDVPRDGDAASPIRGEAQDVPKDSIREDSRTAALFHREKRTQTGIEPQADVHFEQELRSWPLGAGGQDVGGRRAGDAEREKRRDKPRGKIQREERGS
jgi:hypothetical protein